MFGSAYNASKAALHSYSDTLRVELAPFNVKVVTIVTGGVKSRIARVDRTLPENSIYVSIEADYMRRTKHSQEVGMPNEQYAKSVVRQLLQSPKKKYIWEGSKSWLVWFVTTFLPKSFLVNICLEHSGERLALIQGRSITCRAHSICGSWRASMSTPRSCCRGDQAAGIIHMSTEAIVTLPCSVRNEQRYFLLSSSLADSRLIMSSKRDSRCNDGPKQVLSCSTHIQRRTTAREDRVSSKTIKESAFSMMCAQ